jgi:hypothetical protein
VSRRLALLGAAAVAAAVVALLLLLNDDDDHAGPPRADAVRNCASRVEGGHLRTSGRRDLLAGPIVFYGLRSAGADALRDPAHAFQTKKGEYPPLKVITEVAANSVVTVSIPPGDRRQAALLYRFRGGYRALGYRISDGQRVVRFESCPQNRRRFSSRGVVGPRTQYNGGFVFSEPQCVRLDVFVDGRSRRYTVAYGVRASRCD